ncbi:MAG: metal ABC transporter permease, partial [bacterium]|nr:metal ABC transporter permease [bacterium]
MEDFIDVMLRPFIACILLTGIHVYFGLYVIDRGLIFVDLAMAQIAALGSSLGVLLGFGLHSTLNYWFALGSTLIAAVFLSQINKKKN